MKEKFIVLMGCLLCFTLISCSPKQHLIKLPVQVKLSGEDANCQALDFGLGAFSLQNMAFFISGAYLQHEEQRFPLKPLNNSGVSLVRIDASTCRGEVAFVSEHQFKKGMEFIFDMGLPFDLNHQNPLTLPPPLNEPDMFWTWRNGYKFLRIDMQSRHDNWAYHLGSVGCVSESAVRAPKQACAKPGLSTHILEIPDRRIPTLTFNLDALLGDVRVTKLNRCVMHGDTEPACGWLFLNLTTPDNGVFGLEVR